MAGKTVAITGCTSGTGLNLAQRCGALGAQVFMLNRPSLRSASALKVMHREQFDARLIECDLSNLASVRSAIQQLTDACPNGLDVLCNNAGIMAAPDQPTIDGFDVQMQSNYLSHFLLTSGVFPLLEQAVRVRGEARVVNHSSGARRGVPLQARYLAKHAAGFGGDGFPGLAKWRRYQQSKLANLLFTYSLHDAIGHQRPELAGKLKSLCAHPGPTQTELQAKTLASGSIGWLDRLIVAAIVKQAHSVENGTMGLVRACCAPDVKSLGFYGPIGRGRPGPAVLLPAERNGPGEALVWERSMKSLGLADFFTSV
ncbi:SDR family NAD(P)-dependent oxidoreductase [Reinekea sp.]|jgi:NAD(P)-dependent dehydrogenase (short-subunit alcohol dehydrogenase family)|uniref:SDR family NAD(P)-dependent oxidoreductase n=1 Tax=Reinekea sp. TaxID=1970455 RepID=UPI002A8194AF|nr:SDR family NAD(P)-dependent oxidoreductase [Reinekea sp.]